MDATLELPDPRRWPAPASAPPAARTLHGHALASLAATAGADAAREDAAIDASLRAWLDAGDGVALAQAFDAAPSADVHRHLWRRLAACEVAALRGPALAAPLFAVPLVIVTGREAPSAAADMLDAVLPAPAHAAHLLREHGALGGSRQFTLSPALVDAGALGVEALPALVAHARAALDAAASSPLALPPSPIVVDTAQELAHLRFLPGSLVCGPDADPFAERGVGRWGMPLARLVSEALAVPGITVLALPRAPQRLVPALAAGRAAQREIALQLFAGNALRRLRASYGEPTAVISAHEAHDAPGGGELRVSLSSPFGPRDAEGFRFPLAPYERTPDAVAGIVELLRDCRVADVRTIAGVQPDRDAATGLLRFCKPDAPATGAVH